MRVAVLYNDPSQEGTFDAQDVVVQVDAIDGALRQLGHEPAPLACTLDLAAARARLAELQPDVVFNLVESLGGTDRLMHLATSLLDAMQLPYTGARTKAILASSDKARAKQQLRRAGLPTPASTAAEPTPAHTSTETNGWGPRFPSRFIIKSTYEHASRGIDDGAVVDAADAAELQAAIERQVARHNLPCFAEQYIDGREFNISVLAGGDGPFVLPHAEIDFAAFPPDKPRIVGYEAKWSGQSFEYRHTPRRFDFADADRGLLEQLSGLTRSCWDLFELTGYARVDFRVDGQGQPWILEVNANPCLSPDAGFAAALRQAGIAYEQAIQQILDDAVRSAETE